MFGMKVAEANGRLHLGWLLGVVVGLFLALSVSACNTMRGAGEDISAAGGAMSGTAEDVEEDVD